MKMVGHFLTAWIVIVKQAFWHAVELWLLTSLVIIMVSMNITKSVRTRNATLPSLWEKTEIIVKVISHRLFIRTITSITVVCNSYSAYKSLSIVLENQNCMCMAWAKDPMMAHKFWFSKKNQNQFWFSKKNQNQTRNKTERIKITYSCVTSHWVLEEEQSIFGLNEFEIFNLKSCLLQSSYRHKINSMSKNQFSRLDQYALAQFCLLVRFKL